MSMRRYHGSCACGRVAITVDLDLSAGTFKCNCESCTKTRFWGAVVPRDALAVTAGGTELTTWLSSVEHHFCRHCGAKVFNQGMSPQGPFACVSLAVLDDLTPEAWAASPVRFMDGRNGDQRESPAFTAHL